MENIRIKSNFLYRLKVDLCLIKSVFGWEANTTNSGESVFPILISWLHLPVSEH